MTRAKRVHQGERTQHEVPTEHHGEPMEGLEVPAGRTGTLTVHDDGTSEAHLEPEGRLCKSCAKAAANAELPAGSRWAEVTAPSGTRHLAEGSGALKALCGANATGWWDS